MLNNNLIRWVVGILIVVSLLTSLYSSYQFSSAVDSLSESTKKLNAELNPYPSQVESIKSFLTEQGYELISVSASNLSKDAPFLDWYNIQDNTICQEGERFCKTNKIHVSIAMKSWGSRSAQIDSALLTSNVAFPNAFVYAINIQSPTDSCNYVIFGDTYRKYSDELGACFPESESGGMALSGECFDSEGSWKPEVQNRLNGLKAQIDAEVEKYKACS
jgi:hypothetical protein